MKNKILLGVIGFLQAGLAWPDISGAYNPASQPAVAAFNAEEKALSECSTSQVEFVETKGTLSIDWTGRCVDGKREGQGILSWKTDRTYEIHYEANKARPFEVVYTKGQAFEQKAEGRFVKGQRVGLWCGTSKTTGESYKYEEGCVILAGHGKPLTGIFRKQPDGVWQEYVGGNKTDVRLAAGSLESYSDSVIDDVLANRPIRQRALVVQSQILVDLVRGSKIVFTPSTTPVSLKNKRVAVVLSSDTAMELERFSREREALIAATSKLENDEWRSKFIAYSNPADMLVGIKKVLGNHAKSVQPVDDLTGLKKGSFDYAFILDWKSQSQLDRIADYYRSPRDLEEAIIAEQSLTGFLVDRELKATRKFSTKDNHSESKNWYARSGDLRFLAEFFVSVWGYAPATSLNSQLNEFLGE